MKHRTTIVGTALAAAIFAACLPLSAQKLNPVRWTLELEPSRVAPGAHVLGKLTARIDPGWHLYALSAPKPIIPTSIDLSSPIIDKLSVFQPKAKTIFDKNFGFNVEMYEGEAVFLLDMHVAGNAAAGAGELEARTRFQSCNDTMCLPPRRVQAASTLTVDPAAVAPTPVIPADYKEFSAQAAPPAPATTPAPTQPPAGDAQSTAAFLLVAFGFGLAAIFTPCVFPMIPITVSFFLNKQEGGRGQSISQAVTFCLGIIVFFTAIGLATTALLGPFGVVQLGSNVWVNAFIVAVFFVFGLSLLGAFEITVPYTVLTALDRASQKGGSSGTLLMGLTFSLTAFACVGPFMGTLLAASVQGGGLRPALGMATFAAGLALPFFFLALFPSYLKRMPKSGLWMERVKVVMGFVILAAMFKYLSSIDQVLQWNVLTRDRFLAIWIVLFGLAGAYLLGFLRFRGVKPDEPVGMGRLLLGAAFAIFALSLVPGMVGGRLGELDAFVPPPAARQASGDPGGAVWIENRYREALDRARAENKLVFVSFSGYACTNCHWMKANMFTRPEIAAALNNYVLLELYTDGTDQASQDNQKLQEAKFSTVAIPYYAVMNPDEKVVATFPGLTRNPQEFLTFLRPEN